MGCWFISPNKAKPSWESCFIVRNVVLRNVLYSSSLLFRDFADRQKRAPQNSAQENSLRPAKMVMEEKTMPLLDPIPSPVLHADFAALEWEPLLALIAGFAASPVGHRAILDLKPSTDQPWIALQHQLTGELRLALAEQVSIPLGG